MEDITDLVRAEPVTAKAIKRRAHEGLTGCVGNLAGVRARIESALELAAQAEG